VRNEGAKKKKSTFLECGYVLLNTKGMSEPEEFFFMVCTINKKGEGSLKRSPRLMPISCKISICLR
jgi:hypothetical protein